MSDNTDEAWDVNRDPVFRWSKVVFFVAALVVCAAGSIPLIGISLQLQTEPNPGPAHVAIVVYALPTAASSMSLVVIASISRRLSNWQRAIAGGIGVIGIASIGMAFLSSL